MIKPVKTIGNPLSWTMDAVFGSLRYAKDAAHEIQGDRLAPPEVRRLDIGDLRVALRKGWEDIAAFRTDVIFLVIFYPIIGLILAAFAFHSDLLPLLFPLMSGFALLGPIAAIGLYEMSRRRERGEPASFGSAFSVLGNPAIGAILTIGLGLVVIFIAWLLTAYLIFVLTLGPEMPVSVTAFIRDIFTTGAGWAMLIIGCGVGFVFAAVTLAMTVVSVPLLLDRHVGVWVAVTTSLRLTRENPVTVGTWGLIVATLLVIGTIPLLIGLILVLPVLGHATWHLYRRAIVQPEAQRAAPGVVAPSNSVHL